MAHNEHPTKKKAHTSGRHTAASVGSRCYFFCFFIQWHTKPIIIIYANFFSCVYAGTSAKLCGAVAKQLRNRTYIISLSGSLALVFVSFTVSCSLCTNAENYKIARAIKTLLVFVVSYFVGCFSYFFFLFVSYFGLMASIWSSVCPLLLLLLHNNRVEFRRRKCDSLNVNIQTWWTWSEWREREREYHRIFFLKVFLTRFLRDKLAMKKLVKPHNIIYELRVIQFKIDVNAKAS